MATWITRLEESVSGHIPFMCLQYKGKDSGYHTIPAVFIGSLSSFDEQNIAIMVRISFILLHENCRGRRYMVLLLGLFTSLIVHILVK